MTSIDHLGILAPEFPPQLGGMAEFASSLAQALSTLTHVTLYSTSEKGLAQFPFTQKPVLSLHPQVDFERLRGEQVDGWLSLNAGLTPLAKSLDKPFFAYMHGNDFLEPWIPCGPAWFERIRRPYAGKIRHALRRTALSNSVHRVRWLFCNSTRTAQLIHSQLGVETDRITVSPPGVDEAFFTVKRARDSKKLRLLTVSSLSRYVRRKNIDGVLEAIRLLQPKMDIDYTVVGGGDDLPRLAALAQELGVDQQTHFKGRVDRSELLNSYSEADLFILASKATRRDVEGFGIVYLEASAAGVPVICSIEGGATDAVVDGRNGLLIENSSPECIAAGIERFAEKSDSFSPTKIRALAEEFRWDVLAPKLFLQMTAVL